MSPWPANMESIVERLRTAREKTNRKSMLLSADYATKHRDTVVVIDAAHEIGMNIVIAQPEAPQGPAPTSRCARRRRPRRPRRESRQWKVAESCWQRRSLLIELLVLLGARQRRSSSFSHMATGAGLPWRLPRCWLFSCLASAQKSTLLVPAFIRPGPNAGTVSSAGGENAHRHAGVLAGTYRVVELELRRIVAAGQVGFHDDPSCHLEHPPWQVIGAPWNRFGWPVRRRALESALRGTMPDILCVQEALEEQVNDLAGMRRGYGHVGVGRDDGRSAGEFCAIFFDRERFDELDGGTFWLEEPSNLPPVQTLLGPKRICTWVRLRDRQSGRFLRVYNTHQYLTERARLEAARIMLATNRPG